MNPVCYVAESQNSIQRDCNTRFFGVGFFMTQHPTGLLRTTENIFESCFGFA
jgi:hypothetical protein